MKSLAIFDMDGLLINSESIWEQAEIGFFQEQGAFISLELCEKVKGFRVQESIEFFKNIFTNLTQPTDYYFKEIIKRVKVLVEKEGKIMEGVDHAIELCKQNNMKLAVASSSPMELILFNLKKIGIINQFDLICSGEHETFGKPHPAIFLTTAKKMSTNPNDCVVFEDSLNGVIAGKAAKMKVIVVPDPKNKNNPKFSISDCLLNSLKELKISDLD